MIRKNTVVTVALIAAVALVAPAPTTAQEDIPGQGAEREQGWQRRGPGGRGHTGFGMGPLGALWGPGGPGGKGLRMALGSLDLSESQRDEIKSIFVAERDAVQADHERMRDLSDELRAQFETDPYDEEAIRAKASAVAEVGVDMAVLRARQVGRVRAVLTPDQLAELEELKARRDAFRSERREHFERRREFRRNR